MLKMKKTNTKHEKVNLFFSAFLMIAYIICGYFFVSFADTQPEPLKSIVTVIIFVVFGLLVFYATRVGEGRMVKRFSLGTLIVLDIPALYIILASVFEFMPFHDALAGKDGLVPVALLAAVALGYGIPYTFISGFETVTEEELNAGNKESTDDEVLEGGVEADLQDADAEDNDEPVETEYEAEEIVVDGTAGDIEDEE